MEFVIVQPKKWGVCDVKKTTWLYFHAVPEKGYTTQLQPQASLGVIVAEHGTSSVSL